MRIRPYASDSDFGALRGWIDDERTHALWCANRMTFPLDRESFENAVRGPGNRPFTAVDEDGRPIGFFCLSVEARGGEARLKFVVVDPKRRCKGCGREMLALAARYAFDEAGAHALRLSVFSPNERAKRCYLAVGFSVCGLETGAFRFQGESWDRVVMVKTDAT